jgi:uncharacterized protein (PEP-CTERM system associated)
MAEARAGARRPRQAGPADGVSRRAQLRLLTLLAALLALLARPASGNNWEVATSLSVVETYTDNISLVLDAAKQSDWVTQVTPGISITSEGPRLRLRASYAPEFAYYAKGTNEDRVFQRGRAVGNLELADKLLYIEAGANIDQYPVTLQGPLSISNVNTTGNRATTSSSYVSPYLLRDFESVAKGEARFTHTVVKASEQTVLSDSEANRANLRLESGPAYKRLTWDLRYFGEEIVYESGQETLSEVFTASSRLLITRNVGLLAQAGYESYDPGISALVSEGPRWSAGLEWTPTPRTRIAGTAGKRLDDDAYTFEFRHRTRLSTWSASYNEDVTTSRSEFFVPETASTASTLDQLFATQYPDPVARQKAVQEFIARTGLPPSLGAPVNFFSDLLFRQRSWLGSLGIRGARNTLLANVFWAARDVLLGGVILPVSGDFAASNSIRLTGASLAWGWRVTAQNTWNVTAGHTRDEFIDSGRVDDLSYVVTGLTRQFQPKLSGSLHYRWLQRESTISALSYSENAAIAALEMKF